MTRYLQLREQLESVFRWMAYCSNEYCRVKPMTNEFMSIIALLESEELKAISEERETDEISRC